MRTIKQMIADRVIRTGGMLPNESICDRILLCDKVSAPEVVRMTTLGDATQVVNEHNPHWKSELESSALMLLDSRKFYDFPLCTILSPNKTDSLQEEEHRIFRRELSKYSQKDPILDQIDLLSQSWQIPKSISDDIRLVSDEMISNALCNAPFVDHLDKGKPQEIELPDGLEASIQIGRNGDHLAVVCQDPFGSLRVRPFLKGIQKGYDVGQRKETAWAQEGTGVGSLLIFETSLSLYLGVIEKKKTIFGCVFSLVKGARKRRDLCKGIHFVED